jgi:hypothetical protein
MKAQVPDIVVSNVLIKFVMSYKFINKLRAGEVDTVEVALPKTITIPNSNEVVKVVLKESSDDNGGQLRADEHSKPNATVSRGVGNKPKPAKDV